MRVTVVARLAAAVLWVAAAATDASDYEEPLEDISCEARCMRIHERSLDRIGFTSDKADHLIEKGKAHPKMRDVCWKMHDYFYCMKGCTRTKEHEKYVRHVKARCQSAIEDLEPGLACLYKYRSFLEIRCSSFMNEAIRLKRMDSPELLPDRETCRFLHLNALCLENSVGAFCPMARPFFRRLTLRDYFLNYILPLNDDLLFDDQDLDACQMKDFVKEALDGLRVSPAGQFYGLAYGAGSLWATTSPSSVTPSTTGGKDGHFDNLNLTSFEREVLSMSSSSTYPSTYHHIKNPLMTTSLRPGVTPDYYYDNPYFMGSSSSRPESTTREFTKAETSSLWEVDYGEASSVPGNAKDSGAEIIEDEVETSSQYKDDDSLQRPPDEDEDTEEGAWIEEAEREGEGEGEAVAWSSTIGSIDHTRTAETATSPGIRTLSPSSMKTSLGTSTSSANFVVTTPKRLESSTLPPRDEYYDYTRDDSLSATPSYTITGPDRTYPPAYGSSATVSPEYPDRTTAGSTTRKATTLSYPEFAHDTRRTTQPNWDRSTLLENEYAEPVTVPIIRGQRVENEDLNTDTEAETSSSRNHSIYVTKEAAEKVHSINPLWTAITGNARTITVTPASSPHRPSSSTGANRIRVTASGSSSSRTTNTHYDIVATTTTATDEEGNIEGTTRPGVRRKVFESKEDLAYTPPNFHYSSFRGGEAAWKIAHNYSQSFHPEASFVTPVYVKASSIFGSEEDDMNRVTTSIPKSSTSSGAPDNTQKAEEDVVIYEHGVDDIPSSISPLPHDYSITAIELEPPETSTIRPEGKRKNDVESRMREREERKRKKEGRRKGTNAPPNEFPYMSSTPRDVEPERDQGLDENEIEVIRRGEAEKRFDEAIVQEELAVSSAESSTDGVPLFTPLLNGGRVAVKPIKHFRSAIGGKSENPRESEEIFREWPDTDADESELDSDGDEYESDVYITTDLQDGPGDESAEIRRRVTFILIYSSVFLFLLLTLVCVGFCCLLRARQQRNMDGMFKLHETTI